MAVIYVVFITSNNTNKNLTTFVVNICLLSNIRRQLLSILQPNNVCRHYYNNTKNLQRLFSILQRKYLSTLQRKYLTTIACNITNVKFNNVCQFYNKKNKNYFTTNVVKYTKLKFSI